MKVKGFLCFALALVLCSSCEYLLDEVIDDMLYNARCEVVRQTELILVKPGKAVMEVKVKNKGSLDACDVWVSVCLMNGDLLVEKQQVYIPYLSAKSSTTVRLTFTQLIYGSEYSRVDVSLYWTEVEREDYDDDDW
ncbi:hypothetical protein KDU71_18360 [Carboxylicivirga sediminis]|uniref:CARDB domain-containing protein n=1 Tax=Carboxylicivirga sediminis TaxID=2006564 RepID=A0A941IZS0_9BACT|nr:CARDB domain-containing protein [Carboxylicivirga sediminis]MBR8537539.1 hypothetical protein [Carboxylicivirga sediminis]